MKKYVVTVDDWKVEIPGPHWMDELVVDTIEAENIGEAVGKFIQKRLKNPNFKDEKSAELNFSVEFDYSGETEDADYVPGFCFIKYSKTVYSLAEIEEGTTFYNVE